MPLPDIYLLVAGNWKRIECNDIVFVESSAHYCKFVTRQGTYIQEVPISFVEEQLDPGYFCRVHKSYIAGMKHICHFNKEVIEFEGYTVPIGRSWYQSFINRANRMLSKDKNRKDQM